MEASAAAAAVKAAKKTLKKSDSGEMKLKELAKVVVTKLDNNNNNNNSKSNTTDNNDDDNNNDRNSSRISTKQVRRWIQESDKFSMDGKTIRLLKRKRSRSSSPKDYANAELNNKKSSSKKIKGNDESSKIGGGDADADADDVSTWRKKNKIVVMLHNEKTTTTTTTTTTQQESQQEQESHYLPFRTFQECTPALAPALIQQCTVGNGFVHPSPIQAQSWPILTTTTTTTTTTTSSSGSSSSNNKHKDMVGIAETGSGKTLAFCLPALSAMAAANNDNNSKKKQQQQQWQRGRSPRMLVLAPTRELAMQSDQVLKEFGAVVGLKSIVLYGGVPKYTQVAELKRGVDCIVATPGRLVDLVQEKSCNLSAIQHLVLDEADRMLDLGFEQDVRFIIAQCKTKTNRQTCMFSATWPAAVAKIAHDFMVDPIRVYVGFESITTTTGSSNSDSGDDDDKSSAMIDDSFTANKRVQQTVLVLEDRQRESKLEEILNQVHAQKNRVLVFALYKKEAERLEYSLRRNGWNCCSIHGNKHQAARTEALKQFKDGTCPLLVATDVAARGLDIPNVEVVINYTFPLTIEDYVHRIGRTGRAGKTGASFTFFQTTDKSRAGELQQVLRQADQPVPDDLMKFGSAIKKKEHKLYGNFGPKDFGEPVKKATKITFNYSDDEE